MNNHMETLLPVRKERPEESESGPPEFHARAEGLYLSGLIARLRRELGRGLHSPAARNAHWMLAGQGLSYVTQAGYFILIARLMGSVEYGIYAGALAFVSLISAYSTLGSPSIFLRYVSRDNSRFSEYWGNTLLITMTLGTVFTVGLVLAGPRVSHSYTWLLIATIAFSECICRQITIAGGSVFQTFERLRLTAIMNLLTNTLRLVAAIVLMLTLRKVSAARWAIATLLVSVISALVAVWLITRLYGRPRTSLKVAAARAGEGFLYSMTYSTTTVYNDVDKTMLSHYGMNAANGIYTMAYRFVDIACMPLAAIQAAMFPRFFKRGADGIAGTSELASRILTRTASIGFFAALMLYVGAPIIPRILGNQFSDSTNALRWLCLLPLFRSFHSSGGDALSGAGRPDLRLISQIIAASFNFGVNLYLIPHYSWRGAAWSSLASDGLLGAMNWSWVFVLTRVMRGGRHVRASC